MEKAYIWGTGIWARKALDAVEETNCQIEAFVDNNPAKQGTEFAGKMVVSQAEVSQDAFIIIAVRNNPEAVLYQLEQKGCGCHNAIVFYDEKSMENEKYRAILNYEKWRIAFLEYKLDRLEKTVSFRFRNLGYELVDEWEKGKFWYPKRGKTEEAIEKIVTEGCSLIRFGDGEFEIMAGRERAPFQKHDPLLAEKLIKAIQSKSPRLLITIADNYGSLEKYTEETADGIRAYMSDEVRRDHRRFLSEDRVYYDTAMFKCYMPYRDKASAAEKWRQIKRIWTGREVVIAEGYETRTGYGNDLLADAKRVQRLLAPTKNAFSLYDEIIARLMEIDKSKLILMALGPAGKAMIPDLAEQGYQAVDIGQVDMDYEWYLAGTGKRVPIFDKYVSQLPPMAIDDVSDGEYLSQIIGKVGC